MDEERVIRAVERTLPAVVSILADKRKKRSSKKGGVSEAPEQGSGFVIEPDGLILTDTHVVEDDAEYRVAVPDMGEFPAEIVSRDWVKDIALLKIEAENLPTIPLGESSNLRLGQSVLAIGNALGLFENTVSLGIISGLSRTIDAKGDPSLPPHEIRGLIQTDAAINPGNSGGPLIDLEGRAVGINAATISNAENIGFAIPIDAARHDLDEVRKYGHVRQPYFGARYIVIDEPFSKKKNLSSTYGAWITSGHAKEQGVVPGSPAEKAGLKDGDVVLEWNGEKITRPHPLQKHLDDASVGDNVRLLVARGKKTVALSVTLGEKK